MAEDDVEEVLAKPLGVLKAIARNLGFILGEMGRHWRVISGK